MQPTENPNLPPNPNQVPTSEAVAPEAPAAPEVAPQVGQSAPAVAPVVPPASLPTVPDPATPAVPAVDPAAAPQAPVATGPDQAGDVDVLEKEWVDQADRIVAQTKDDPYVEEEAVEALQQDYLKKRYGHDVQKPEGQ